MIQRSRPGAWFLVLAQVIGCGEDEVYTVPAAPESSAEPSAEVDPVRSSAPSSQASSSSGPALVLTNLASSVPVSTVRKWADFSGPNTPSELSAGSRGWLVVPMSSGWETLKLSVESVARVEAPFAVVQSERGDIFVPGAFTAPLRRPEGLLKGDAVVVPAMGSRAVARVVSVAADGVSVRFRYAGELKELSIPQSDVIKLDGTLKFGAVAVARDSTHNSLGEEKVVWRGGQFVSTAEGKSWLVTWSGRPFRLPANFIRAMSIHHTHKAGDKVMVLQGEELVSGSVLKSEEDGLRYVVKLVSGTETSVPFDMVTSPLP
jgi:hypothetical protein